MEAFFKIHPAAHRRGRAWANSCSVKFRQSALSRIRKSARWELDGLGHGGVAAMLAQPASVRVELRPRLHARILRAKSRVETLRSSHQLAVGGNRGARLPASCCPPAALWARSVAGPLVANSARLIVNGPSSKSPRLRNLEGDPASSDSHTGRWLFARKRSKER